MAQGYKSRVPHGTSCEISIVIQQLLKGHGM